MPAQRRYQAVLKAVIAEGAFLRDMLLRAHVNHAERAGRDAISTAVANGFLDVHGVKLGAHDRPGRTNLKTGRIHAVLADVRHHQPAPLGSIGD